jgi:MFS family permease
VGARRSAGAGSRMTRAFSALGRRLDAVVAVMRHRDLRRLQIGWAAFFLVDGLSLVALSVWAFGEGGTSAVGFVGLARLLPGAIALPFGAWAADRFPRRLVLTAVFISIAVTQAAIAIALARDAPPIAVYVLVGASSLAATPYRSAQLALAPLVARSPAELVAMNVTAGTFEGLVTFAGPALAALLLLATGPWFVVAVAAVACIGGLLAVAGIYV